LAKEEIDNAKMPNKNYTRIFIKRAQEKDASMDFLDSNKKIALQKFYSKNPVVMPNKEIKPLRFNKLDKFTTKLENETGWDTWTPWPSRTPMVERNNKRKYPTH
jgi:hypothetical protein